MDEASNTAAIALGAVMGAVILLMLCCFRYYGRENNAEVAVDNNPNLPAQEPVIIPPQLNQTNNNLQTNHNDNQLQNGNRVLQIHEGQNVFTEIVINDNDAEVIKVDKIKITYEEMRKR